MPTPDYYLNDDPYTLSIQSEYKSHMGTLFGITFPDLKQSEIDDIVSSIFDFETQIANFSLSRADHRNPVLTYNKMSFDVCFPSFSLSLFLSFSLSLFLFSLFLSFSLQTEETNWLIDRLVDSLQRISKKLRQTLIGRASLRQFSSLQTLTNSTLQSPSSLKESIVF